MNAAIYCRVSTDEQAQNGTSLETQRERTTAFVEQKAWTLAGEFTDAGVSGTKGSRPALDRLMEACRNGQIEVVVVTKLDRFGRSNRHLANTLGELDDLGVAFISLAEQFDTSTPMGRGMLAISGVFAEIEHATIKERTRAGKQAIKAQGYWAGGCVPFGFEPVQDGAHKRLVVNEHEAETVRLAATLLVDEGCSAHEVAQRLNGLVRLPRKAKGWDHTLLRYMLRRTSVVPEIITQDRFDQVQAALAATALNPQRVKDHVYPLSLRLFGKCGAPYRGVFRKELATPRRYYICKNKDWEQRTIRCDDLSLHAEDIELVVWEQVCDILSKPERLLALAEEYLGLRSQQVEFERDEHEVTQSKLTELDRAIQSLLVTQAKAGLDPADIEQAVADLTREREALRRHLLMLDTWRDESALESQRMRRLWDLAEGAHKRLPQMTHEEQKQMLDLLDVRVTVLEHATKDAPTKVRIEGVVGGVALTNAARDLDEIERRTGSARGRAAAVSLRGARARR